MRNTHPFILDSGNVVDANRQGIIGRARHNLRLYLRLAWGKAE